MCRPMGTILSRSGEALLEYCSCDVELEMKGRSHVWWRMAKAKTRFAIGKKAAKARGSTPFNKANATPASRRHLSTDGRLSLQGGPVSSQVARARGRVELPLQHSDVHARVRRRPRLHHLVPRHCRAVRCTCRWVCLVVVGKGG